MLSNFKFIQLEIGKREKLRVWMTSTYDGDLDWLIKFWKNDLSDYQMIQQSKQATVVKGKNPNLACNIYLKKLHIRKRVDFIKNSLRKSRARRAVEMGEIAETNGFFVSKALFLIESVKNGFHYESGIITESIEGAISVGALLRELKDKRSRLIQFVQSFARLIGRWHKKGLYHGDLRLGNVLTKWVDGQYTFFFLDNERNRFYSYQVPTAKVTHNLMQIFMCVAKYPEEVQNTFWNSYNDVMKFPPKLYAKIKRNALTTVYERWDAKKNR